MKIPTYQRHELGEILADLIERIPKDAVIRFNYKNDGLSTPESILEGLRTITPKEGAEIPEISDNSRSTIYVTNDQIARILLNEEGLTLTLGYPGIVVNTTLKHEKYRPAEEEEKDTE